MGKRRGTFISIEGIDCSGKSSLIEALSNKMNNHIIFVKSLSDSPYGLEAKRLLSNSKEKFDYTRFSVLCLLDLLYLSEKIIEPALDAGQTVICDRWYHSTFVYFVGCSIDKRNNADIITQLINALPLSRPVRTYILYCPIHIVQERMKNRGGALDIMEADEKRLECIQNMYNTLSVEPNIEILDGTKDSVKLAQEILNYISS